MRYYSVRADVLLCVMTGFITDVALSDNDYCQKDTECTASLTNHSSFFKNGDVLVYTVATSDTDGYRRYLHSAERNNINPIVLGFGQEWKGGDNIKAMAGGGWKVNLLKEALKDHENDLDTIVIFTDGYDVMFLSNINLIQTTFVNTGYRILFGAEAACWPDKSLSEDYPTVKGSQKRYLNSGMFIGYVREILKLLNRETIGNTDDDQLFYTHAYLDKEFREEVKMGLDIDSAIFQNLNGATTDVELTAPKDTDAPGNQILRNVFTLTAPMVVHGNGPSKLYLNSLSNYLAGAWNPESGCEFCKAGQMSMEEMAESNYPTVLLAVFAEEPIPFIEEQLELITGLAYPKNKIHFFIHNNVKYHSDTFNEFVEKHGDDYASMKQIKAEDAISEWNARDLSLNRCINLKCDFYFSVDAIAHLDNPFTLKLLIEQNRTVVAPLLPRPGKAWSNFWGALTTDGYYARSADYMDIVQNNKRGLWNVPYVAHCYLVNATVLNQYDRNKIHYSRGNLDPDMAFCANIRDLDVFLYVSNRLDFGHLVNPETFDITLVEPEMYQIFDNDKDWEKRFIHPDYLDTLNPDTTNEQPCPDVYRFPIVTRTFCNSLIHMMEAFGKWSDGSNQDTRLEGGYEAVPTRDIHMNQVGWDGHWLHFLDRYVRPLQEHVFTGYIHDPPRSLMNFVVRYRPDEQPLLRPHHDSSTYTINVALNEREVDFQGGGCRFIRYDCSVIDTKPGWLLMHPGRLTHYHEGLRVTNGTRYIMISFLDP